jgi:hypothetical protein
MDSGKALEPEHRVKRGYSMNLSGAMSQPRHRLRT